MNHARIIFMGTPDFAVPALEALIAAGHDVICVYTQPPRPKGRGQQVQKSPVHLCAEKYDLPVRHPLNFKDPQIRAEFAALKADIAVVAAYGLILPQEVLDAPEHGCLNIHASLLPRWRGASPIQHAIWHGDTKSGVAIMQMEKGLDTGPVLTTRDLDIMPQTTAQSLHDDLGRAGASLIVQTLDNLEHITPQKQDDALACYAPLLRKSDGHIDWAQTAEQIDRQVRALNPWPGTYSLIDGKRLRVLSVALTDQASDQQPGTILDKYGLVACGGKTTLQLLQIQPESAKIMDFAAALNGQLVKMGDRLT